MTEGTLSSQRLIRLAPAALIVAAVSLTLGRILHPTNDLAGWTSPLWGPSHVLWLVGLVTGMIEGRLRQGRLPYARPGRVACRTLRP